MKQYERFINVKFSYNGDLGILQVQSKVNIQFVNSLLHENIITREEHQEAIESIHEYFKEELIKALNNIVYTLN